MFKIVRQRVKEQEWGIFYFLRKSFRFILFK